MKEFEDIDRLLNEKGTFSSEQLFKCILGLNKTESKILGYMLKNKDIRVSKIAKVLEMDRTSIQKAVHNLIKLNFIERKSISLKDFTRKKGFENPKKQGYLYVYNAKDIYSIKIHFKKLLDKWYNAMLKYIENLENLCECCGFKFAPC
ncbi:MAG: helix-turn-helix domain-containing protein [Candidatus Odinarchaeota archaeon]